MSVRGELQTGRMTNLQKCHSVTQCDGKHCQTNDNGVDKQVAPLASPSPSTVLHQLLSNSLSANWSMCVRHRAYAIVLVINNNNNVSISNCHIFTQTIKYRTRHLTLCPFAYLHNSCLAFEYEKSPAILVWGTLTFDLWSDAADTFTSIQQKGVMGPCTHRYLPAACLWQINKPGAMPVIN